MADPSLCLLGARELHALMTRKEVSASEVMQAHLAQIERVNPRVNAIVTLRADLAEQGAQAADEALARGTPPGPLHGLPIAIKDLMPVRGMRTTQGSPIHANDVPDADGILVERLRAAGAVIIGKTNTPEFGAGSHTFNAVFGATLNPWDTSKTAGGSSGGAAVALASRMLPLADGSDLGGSLRNPANFNNVVGFRPSPGRVPTTAPLAWSPLSVVGPMARNVGDLALMLSAIAGPDDRSPIAIEQPGTLFAGDLQRDFKGTRIAWLGDLGGLPLDPRVRRIIEATLPVFESVGCSVEADRPDFAGADEAFKTLRAWGSAYRHAERYRDHRDLLKATLVREIEDGQRLSGADVSRAEGLRSAYYARVRDFLQRYEFMVLPVNQVPPFPVDIEYPTEIDGVAMGSYIDWMRSCYYISALGLPAISVPAGWTPEGLPVGVQIVGRHHDDLGVLQLAQVFESATAHATRLPPVLD
ncbi:MAG: amidase [Gammaproteobacteria bacterium]|nr:amidase [Gammaproteobacteria bacterium]